MEDEIITYLTIYVLCMVKIIFGPTIGYASGFHPLVSILIAVAGTMTTVIVFTYVGERLRTKIFSKFYKERKVFTKRNRKFVKIWRKYGELGISFLTPILLSPPGGTILVVAFGGNKKKIIGYMLFWNIFWITIITYIYYYSSDTFVDFIK